MDLEVQIDTRRRQQAERAKATRAMELRLPGDVLGFTPSGGDSSKGGSTIAMTASKLVPVGVPVRVIAKTDRVEQAGSRQG